MDVNLPGEIGYWMKTTSKHDCFFKVGPESGPKERIGAIKVLLFAHSEVLQKMLDESPLAETGDIPVTDSDPDTFTNFLKCVYGGTDFVVRKVSYEKCLGMIYLCEKYLALKIKDEISSLLVELYEPLSINEVLVTLSNPACLTSPSNGLVKAIAKVVQNQTEEILNHKLFLDLDSNAVEFIAEQEKISTTETNLWVAIFKWAQKNADSEDPNCIRSHLKDIIKRIRFCTMNPNDFCESVVTTKVLTQDEVFDICYSIGAKTKPKLEGLCCSLVNRSGKQTREITFTYVLNNVKQFTGRTQSPQFQLGEFNWHILLMKNKENHLGIYLNCSNAGLLSEWECTARFEFTLVNHDSEHNFTLSYPYHEFTNKDVDWGFSKFYSPFDELVDIKEGFIKNNSVVIVTHVQLQSKD